jgi:cadmium resistance protein CadD (predicted permease)
MAADVIIGLIGIGAAAFVATNIDDIVVLIVFFSSLTFTVRNIVIGQFLGIGSLIAISALGSLLALVVPSYIIGLMGLLPIAIGIKELLEIRNKNRLREKEVQEEEEGEISKLKSLQQSKKRGYYYHRYFSFISVAAVTISNGGDNIGIYTPLFATYNSSLEVTTLVSVFTVMTAVWCTTGYYLVRHPLLEKKMRHFGRVALPFVLIGLGIYIMTEAFLF